ncbi:hypothetical protein [Oryzibacter oryziterrae]|uniref:hypothetical protein n=1 Tax=Oryzibacter oryziterrae TaxID=2766474 RepID=UPI001F2CDF77|nr:hypothetical protein [Oryzibacter oryziterrae]
MLGFRLGDLAKGAVRATMLLLAATLGLLAASLAHAATPAPALKKQLDTFFSNFSEADLNSFTAGQLSDDAMLAFALDHILINARKELKLTESGETGIAAAALVDKVTLRYFDQKIVTGRKASYPVVIADGEAYVFSQVSGMEELGGGLFTASGDIFSAGSGAVIDPHAKPADWAKAGEDVAKVAGFTATVKAIEKRFVLIEYQVTPQP